MKKEPYPLERKNIHQIRFNSEGSKGLITKVVQIQPLERTGFYNFGFGDLTKDGKVDDTIESNNDDFVRVFATIYQIIEQFLDENRNATLVITGSNTQRTRVYWKLLKRNYKNLISKYVITAIKETDNLIEEVEFELNDEGPFSAFLIKKK